MSEQNLNSPDFRSAATAAAGTAAMAGAMKGKPKWLQWFLAACMTIAALAAIAGIIDKVANVNTLPKCDAQRTRDTLSDLNKKNNLNASAYNFIRQKSASEAEVICTASLALRAGGNVEYDYRIYKADSGIKVEITEWRR
jgi:hypothetical protein